MTLEVVDKVTYTVSVFFVEDENGNTYKITHNEDCDGDLVKEWEVVDEDEDEVTDEKLVDKLMDTCIKELEQKDK